MCKILTILEVSKKQEYIFSSRKLKENADRSEIIRYVTSDEFFVKAAPHLYNKEENLIYAGGGHTILQFDSMKDAKQFAEVVTEKAMADYDSLELFAKHIPYDKESSPGDNLKRLSQELERKKALRKNSLRRMSFGVEALDAVTYQPEQTGSEIGSREEIESRAVKPPAGYSFPVDFKELVQKDNFIAVVHIDGNAMGKRVEHIYETAGNNFENCQKKLYGFSEGIQSDFEDAFRETVREVVKWLPEDEKNARWDKEGCIRLPIRPVILAGDDVCFVTAGSIGLECARIFLESLTKKINKEDHLPYSACAGVALVHMKYPFRQAYDLSEELCSNAKKFGVSLNSEGKISAIDWHLDFGQLENGLSALRRGYETEDGNLLTLRPLTVIVPEGEEKTAEAEKAAKAKKTADVRTYRFFKSLCKAMQDERGRTARGKIKDLRTAMKQGKVEMKFFMEEKEIRDLLYRITSSEYFGEQEWELYQDILTGGKSIEKEPFRSIMNEDRCLLFDAIETVDHFTDLEVKQTCE